MHNYFSGKTILVTGAAGFVGSHLCDALLEQGAKVVGVDNFITGNKSNIDHLLSGKQPAFTFIEADVTQPTHTFIKNTAIDLIFHFASPASPPVYQKYPVETYLVNSLGTHYLLSFLKETNPRARFIYASTSEVYGDPEVHPQTEEYWGRVNPNGPRACYDESKRLGESICGVFERDYDMDVRIVRIFNTYGPRIDLNDGRVIPNFIREALAKVPYTIYGDGTQTRSYCYIDDLVEGVLRLGSYESLKGETINIGNSGEYTILETAHELQKIITSNAALTIEEVMITSHPMPKDDPTRRQPDISKAKKLLNWEPQISFSEGLKRTYQYYSSSL